jgi:hypothetical protein
MTRSTFLGGGEWCRCRAGRLLDCIDGAGAFAGRDLFVPNEGDDECVVSPEANEIVEIVKGTLVGMTADQLFQTEVEGRMMKHDTFPRFSLEKVAAKVRDLQDGPFAFFSSDLLLWLSPAFDSSWVRCISFSGDDDDDFDAMSLGHEVSPDSLPLPSGCKMKLLCWELLGYLSYSILALLRYLTSVAFHLVWHCPLLSFCVIMTTYLFNVVQRKRKHRAKVRDLFGIVREAAYYHLSVGEDHTG